MTLAQRLEVGPPRQGDLPAIVALVQACEAAEHGRPDSNEGDLRSEWTWPRFDPARDARLARDAEGRAVGYARVWRRSEARPELDAGLFVAPGRPAAAGALLDWIEARARESSTGPTVLIFCASVNAAKRDFLAGRGYVPVRSSFRMEIELAAEPAPPSWPAGFQPAAYRRGTDDAVLHATLEEAFADHYRFEPRALEEWSRLALEHEHFAPRASLLVWREGQGVAAVTNYLPPDLGWVGALGVRPAWRGRGLGSALLLESFRAFWAAGRRTVALGVDSQNAHGAVRLYERLGMRASRRYDLFERKLGES